MTIDFDNPEFSRRFRVDRLGSQPATETIEAGPEERARLAARLGLVRLDHLSASVRLQREAGADLVRVSGRLAADVVQTCVVTLEPFPSHVEDSFAVDFGDAAETEADEIDVDMDQDPPEPIVGGVIDIGELTAQYLSLALDPYPRSPGVAMEEVWSDADPGALSPFAVLEGLKLRN